ncbi:phosphoinositide 3-kinase adapter protein 1 [Corythoichthys intestinalis]|uniref:phosphoinositide 3-kinase adapter protein 1 n=1 Tax=Corythoichthys intestinalis TaxID=161448 RepID=UPI0025A55A66|nr:phosphoinositide 3-kinase adapter protein 1 [Corythoichthys intestinalis]XP_057703356.1 phosphoinositide 3-kinase adapter protein 1 [Corythoichthys intestinalis]XP_057703357.1 phosphoinositide 3-kinase adapter protein 1 [Corythoichthys intestinalis]XP_057703358.1 phosphoinositide 3-kinase adapter protein 1 [Corythoichthys intestinalis]XP_057703359.1 phosphoinositide 3-kinase adapter protein 1 [Corythoichthys intestinalis]
MEDHNSCGESVNPASLSTSNLLILHTAEAQEWATYLQQILRKSSKMFHKNAVLLYTIGPTDELHGYNFDRFHTFHCVMLLLTGAFIDLMSEPELQRALQTLLRPSHRVVALLCGVSEEDIMMVDGFEDWSSWKKLHAEDESSVYVSSILETITNSRLQVEHENKGKASEQLHVAGGCATRDPNTDQKQEVMTEECQKITWKDDERMIAGFSVSQEIRTQSHIECLTVQPTRLLTGVEHTIFIIFNEKIDELSSPEVEFCSENNTHKTVPSTLVNEYTLSLTAPEMPAGVVSLTLCSNQLRTSLKCVTYHTNMGEVSRCLENAADPINFLCQAFDLTSNSVEFLDNILVDSIKSKMPAPGLQLFGMRQIEEQNMAAYNRNEELPTLLHFAAKYGLRKLINFLLQIPGALQACSVMNKNGDYPNTLAEKSGFTDLRQFIDGFVQTAATLESSSANNQDLNEDTEDYEVMTVSNSSGCPSDMYESMLGINPECADDLYEVMNSIGENPEEAMLRTFFQAKLQTSVVQDEGNQIQNINLNETDDDFDPYNTSSTDIYDTLNENNVAILSRPPAPIPRPEIEPEPEKPVTYISRVFSDKSMVQSHAGEYQEVHPVMEAPVPLYEPFAGMKTPGQRQLITLQERVKVGEITVDEAVREFKAWQLDLESRASSVRYQQDNLRRLRESINRRHNERDKTGKEFDYNISAPLQRNSFWGATMTLECAVYDGSPRMLPPSSSAAQCIQRGSWKTGSTSSTSSTESNRLSTHSNLSYSSGTDPDLEDSIENLPLPARPPRPSEAAPLIPPRIPPRNSQSASDKMLHKRYVSSPPLLPPQRHSNSAPPVPRRRR